MEFALDKINVTPAQPKRLGKPETRIGEQCDDPPVTRPRMTYERRQLGLVEDGAGAGRSWPRELGRVEARRLPEKVV